MKAILIDPFEQSLQSIEICDGNDSVALNELYELVGEEALDWTKLMPGEAIYLGDRSALHEPPLPSYLIHGHRYPLYGRGVVIGYTAFGKERDTRLTPKDLEKIITWCYP